MFDLIVSLVLEELGKEYIPENVRDRAMVRAIASTFNSDDSTQREVLAQLVARRGKRKATAIREAVLEAALSASSHADEGIRRHRVLAPLLAKILARDDAAMMLRFIPQKSRAYSLTPSKYGYRGGRSYYKPVGWIRYSIKHDDFDRYQDWCIAYHGTKSKNAAKILAEGLRSPTSKKDVAHGQAGGTGSTIYLSPCIEYAAHPVYSQLVELDDDHWAQLVLECRVRPESFRTQGNTLSEKHWHPSIPFDQYRSVGSNVEWLVERPDAVLVSGLMVRELGRRADADIYGPSARFVYQNDDRDPEYVWTMVRQFEMLCGTEKVREVADMAESMCKKRKR